MAHECIRFVDEIALWAFSRGTGTCLWPTEWCEKNCYFKKFYKMGRSKLEWDKLDDDWWKEASVDEFVESLVVHIPYNPSRFRFSIKGEIWTCVGDVEKVRNILDRLPDTLFWIPTRAWQDSVMQKCIEDTVLDAPNARVMASLDPMANEYTLGWLRDRGWSIVYTGDNDLADQLMLAEGGGVYEKMTKDMYRCPKTWDGKMGHCVMCTEGCFKEGRVEVHLKKHR